MVLPVVEPRSVKIAGHHLAYCTNVHPAESWPETRAMLRREIPAVRARLVVGGELPEGAPFAIGLRLSALAAHQLLDGNDLAEFKRWLNDTRTYVFTINGFPYGNFHGTRVKERVFQPDWTSPERVEYTKNLFRILAEIAEPGTSASVSTLPGSHKSFHPDEPVILRNLESFAGWLDDLSGKSGHDFHLGLEPEPFGWFENTEETIAFFAKLAGGHPLRRRIGLNYDACHFAIGFDDARASLDRLKAAGIRISKIHLSNALCFPLDDAASLAAIREFDEPTYFHQVVTRSSSGELRRYADLPLFLADSDRETTGEARVHFHIPLDAEPAPPLASTRRQVIDVLDWCRKNPDACSHFEIETYTWAVLPEPLRRSLTEQIAAEFRWVIPRFFSAPDL